MQDKYEISVALEIQLLLFTLDTHFTFIILHETLIFIHYLHLTFRFHILHTLGNPYFVT